MNAPFPLYVEVKTGREPSKDILPDNLFSTFQGLLEGTPSGSPLTFVVESEADVERYIAAILLGARGVEVSVVNDDGDDVHPIEALRKMPIPEGFQMQLVEMGLIPLTSSVLSQKGESEDHWFV